MLTKISILSFTFLLLKKQKLISFATETEEQNYA